MRLVLKGRLINGQSVRRFEKRFAGYIGMPYAASASSARVTLGMLLRSLNFPSGTEVIIPAYTIKGLVSVIEEAGYRPKTADVNADTFNMDLACLKKAVTEKTRVVVATHMFGSPCEIDKIANFCRRKGLFLVEDCAHAHGAIYKGKKVGSFGDASLFSFGPIKPINCFEGGVVLTRSKTLHAAIQDRVNNLSAPGAVSLMATIARNYAEESVLRSPLFYLFLPVFYFDFLNALLYRVYTSGRCAGRKLANVQAFVGLGQLDELDRRTAERNANSELLRGRIGIRAQVDLEGGVPSGYFLVFRYKGDLRVLQKRLLLAGVDTSVGNELNDRCHKLTGDEAPGADEVYAHAIQVPNYEGLGKKELEKIIYTINDEM
ncbi:MAG: DegT/DnrJ/EryC1/StrS family aminotransferase [Nanobdellota archaeon]